MKSEPLKIFYCTFKKKKKNAGLKDVNTGTQGFACRWLPGTHTENFLCAVVVRVEWGQLQESVSKFNVHRVPWLHIIYPTVGSNQVGCSCTWQRSLSPETNTRATKEIPALNQSWRGCNNPTSNWPYQCHQCPSEGPRTTSLTTDHMLLVRAVLQESRDEYHTVHSLNTLFKTVPETCIVELLHLSWNRMIRRSIQFLIWIIPHRAPVLCLFKLCTSFHSHPWIQTRVTVRKCSIQVKISDLTLKLDGWPSKSTVHLFNGTLSFVYHFEAICEFKLELQSVSAQFWVKISNF